MAETTFYGRAQMGTRRHWVRGSLDDQPVRSLCGEILRDFHHEVEALTPCSRCEADLLRSVIAKFGPTELDDYGWIDGHGAKLLDLTEAEAAALRRAMDEWEQR